MVFWQRPQKQKVLMIFPYGLQTSVPWCLLLAMAEETNKAAFIFLPERFALNPERRIAVRTVLVFLARGGMQQALTFLTWQSRLIVSFSPPVCRSAVFFFLLTVIVLLSRRYRKEEGKLASPNGELYLVEAGWINKASGSGVDSRALCLCLRRTWPLQFLPSPRSPSTSVSFCLQMYATGQECPGLWAL